MFCQPRVLQGTGISIITKWIKKLQSNCEQTCNDTATTSGSLLEEKKVELTYRLPSPPSMVEFLPTSQGEHSIKYWVIHGVSHNTMRLWVKTLKEMYTVVSKEYCWLRTLFKTSRNRTESMWSALTFRKCNNSKLQIYSNVGISEDFILCIENS